MSPDLGDVQRIVLHGYPWRAGMYLMVSFGQGAPCHLLQELLDSRLLVGAGQPQRPAVQCSVGFTRRGLERIGVPSHVMARLALKAPDFWQGAALRASRHAGLRGRSAPECWELAYDTDSLDLVISLHGPSDTDVLAIAKAIGAGKHARGMRIQELPLAQTLPTPHGLEQAVAPGAARADADRIPQWVHFGYRDGLSRIGIVGFKPDKTQDLLPSSMHQPGEFVLGHVADSGADRWVAGPGLRVWPQKVREFFRNASFGVLQQIVQDVDAFESFVKKAADSLASRPADGGSAADPGFDAVAEIKGKLCGRYPGGRPLAVPCQTQDPLTDFDYSLDPMGIGCPFGSHVRRMNPRLHGPGGAARADEPGATAHFTRARPLLRRGMPYGPAWQPPGSGIADAPTADSTTDSSQNSCSQERGLIGHFFCASIEDQFEHLLGEWAERVPLGSPDRGGARDPLVGAHEDGDGPFDIPQPEGVQPLLLDGLRPFVHTVGAAYLFYPSLATVRGIAESELWREAEDDE